MYRYNVSNILSTAEGNEKDEGVIDLELVNHKERLPTITSHWIFDRSINPSRIVNVLKKLLSSVSSIRETADGLTKKLNAHDGVKETLEHIEDKKVMRVLVGGIKVFKETLGKYGDRWPTQIIPATSKISYFTPEKPLYVQSNSQTPFEMRLLWYHLPRCQAR